MEQSRSRNLNTNIVKTKFSLKTHASSDFALQLQNFRSIMELLVQNHNILMLRTEEITFPVKDEPLGPNLSVRAAQVSTEKERQGRKGHREDGRVRRGRARDSELQAA